MKQTSMDLSTLERNRRAREQFFSGRSPAPLGIDPAIVRGWQRCIAMGVEPERPVVFQAIELNKARAAIEASHRLLEAAGDELDQLARSLVPNGAVVMLADPSMIMVGLRGRTDTMPQQLKIASREGIDISERSIGSNAPTIAAAEHTPAVVLRNAHFCSGIASFSCAAAPIRSPGGSLLGVLDVTTCDQPLPSEALFLVSASAKSIENAMFERGHEHLVLKFHPRHDFVGTPLEAIVWCRPNGDIVGANEAALGLLDLRWPLRGAHFDRCFRSEYRSLLAQVRRAERFEAGLTSASGIPLFASIEMPLRVTPRTLAGTPPRAVQIDDLRAQVATASHEPAERSSPPSPAGAAAPDLESSQPASSYTAHPVLSWQRALDLLSAGDGRLRGRLDSALKAFERMTPLLINGETGTGKEIAARSLHAQGAPAGDPFVALTCAAAPEAAFEAGLHEARAGTLFLDGIDDLSERLQLRLLRALQERESAGQEGAAGRRGCLRLISASHRDLGELCEAGQFRADLYYRIKGIRIELPALRNRADRAAVIAAALQHELRKQRPGELLPEPAWSAGAFQCLLDYGWPGNFRELGWVVQAIVLALPAGARIEPDHLPADLLESVHSAVRAGGASRLPAESILGGETAEPGRPELVRLRALADRAIERAIEMHHGNLSSAARELGISRGTLYRRLKSRTDLLPATTIG